VYSRILIPLEHSAVDPGILEYVRPLARMCGSTLVFIHVADGWAARNISHLELKESDEMRDDRAHLEQVAAEVAAEGFQTEAILATGDPGTEIALAATRENCGLIAMATHGHKFFADLWRGSVANEVRHRSMVPVLLVRKKAETKKSAESGE
jgi:nucleotide-binding universal stress UspA family protein